MPTTLLSTSTALQPATAALPAGPRLAHAVRSGSVDRASAPPGRYLAVDDGEERRLVPLTGDVHHIGRGLRADVRLDDASVSRHHAIVARHGAGARIVDDRSMNGTWVNGRRVDQAELADGDVIVVGRVVLTYVDVPAHQPGV